MPEILARGSRIEVRPYSNTHAYHYLGALDGKTGTVEALLHHGTDLEVVVKLDSGVPLPYKALRVIK